MHLCQGPQQIRVRTGRARLVARSILAVVLISSTGSSTSGANEPSTQGSSPTAPGARPALSGAAILEAIWPAHPEWLAMLADIVVKGERISGGDGWFRKSGPQSRFNWATTRTAIDANHDGSVSRSEFPGSDRDFARLDRDRDGVLTAADFDFSPQASTPPVANLLFARADRDSNGKLTREELDAFFQANDPESLGFLSEADLQRAFTSPPPDPKQAHRGPTRWTFLHSFVRRELGAFRAGPALDDHAPDFTLRPIDGGPAVTLSRQVGAKPVVLVFGNFSCTPFRAAAGNLEKLHQRYKDRATFLMVYVREAHPVDGWRMVNNDQAGIAVRQPRSDSERLSVAQACGKSLGLSFPMLVDTIDDDVNNRYSGIPSRFYVIDRQGKVAYKSGRGPFGFKPAEMEHSLVLLLLQESRSH